MIKDIGVNDYSIKVFERQYKVDNGMSYNSYMLLSDKIAIFDTVDKNYIDEWLKNINDALNGKIPDYLVILHMEPDHSAGIIRLIEKYPNICIVGNSKTFMMLSQFFFTLTIKHKLEVKENDILDLGDYKLKFIFAPMIHWPEVMFAYEENEKILFSADAFGKFGTLDTKEDWITEARRYYFGIVGKYGIQVQNILNKLNPVKLNAIYPLHGPKLEDNLDYYLGLYKKWSSYMPEEEGICIVYASIYGNTKYAVDILTDNLSEKYEVFDLNSCDLSMAISKAFQYSKLVIASVTYNSQVFPSVEAFLHGLVERNFQKKRIAIIENGSWGPMAKNYIIKYFKDSKDISFLEKSITIKSSVNEENKLELEELAKTL